MPNNTIDNNGEGVDWNLARRYKEQYPNILIRAVILRDSDLEALEWADILTLNHGTNGYKRYDQRHRARLAQLYPEKACGAEDSCLECKVKCGVGRVSQKMEAVAV